MLAHVVPVTRRFHRMVHAKRHRPDQGCAPGDAARAEVALAAELPRCVRLLGAAGAARSGSDLDLLVDFDRPIGFEIVALKDELERRLGLPVDLVMRRSLRRRIGRRILDEVQPV